MNPALQPCNHPQSYVHRIALAGGLDGSWCTLCGAMREGAGDWKASEYHAFVLESVSKLPPRDKDEDAKLELALANFFPGNLLADAFAAIYRRVDRMCRTIERFSMREDLERVVAEPAAPRIGAEGAGYETAGAPRFRQLVRLDGAGWTLLGLDYEGRVWRGTIDRHEHHHHGDHWTWTLCPARSWEPPVRKDESR